MVGATAIAAEGRASGVRSTVLPRAILASFTGGIRRRARCLLCAALSEQNPQQILQGSEWRSNGFLSTKCCAVRRRSLCFLRRRFATCPLARRDLLSRLASEEAVQQPHSLLPSPIHAARQSAAASRCADLRAGMPAAALERGSLPCLRHSKCRGGLRGCYPRVARMGMERTRFPVASNTALATAGATAMMGVSPAPAGSRSLRSSRITSVLGTSRKRGTR